jgi:hypothetical protein
MAVPAALTSPLPVRTLAVTSLAVEAVAVVAEDLIAVVEEVVLAAVAALTVEVEVVDVEVVVALATVVVGAAAPTAVDSAISREGRRPLSRGATNDYSAERIRIVVDKETT